MQNSAAPRATLLLGPTQTQVRDTESRFKFKPGLGQDLHKVLSSGATSNCNPQDVAAAFMRLHAIENNTQLATCTEFE